MTTQFHELPEPKTFGHGFNYAVWGANTTVTLANVPWNNDYRDVVKFSNQGALDNYINNLSGPITTTTGVTYAAMGRPIRLQIPFEKANTYNYLRAYNPAQPIAGGDTGRAYYYFVVGVNYIAPDTTELLLQLDVFQSFIYGTTFGNIYVERGHLGIANEDGFDNYGRDYLTIPEGFDLGNEYVIARSYGHEIASARFNEFGFPNYTIMVASTTALDTNDYGTMESPKLVSARGSQLENLPNGCELYEFNSLGHFNEFLEIMANKTWVTQGIISIMATPRATRYGMTTVTNFIEREPGQTTPDFPMRRIQGGVLNNVKEPIAYSWRNLIDLGRYSRLKKFLTAPYMVIEMTSYTGTPLVLKPECWQDPNMTVVEIPHLAPPSPRINFIPFRYNATPGVLSYEDGNGVVNDGGEFLNMATGIMNLPTFSLVNNGYISYMAANANSIAFQHSSADWSQQRALQAANTGYDQASSAMLTTNNQTVNQQSAMAQSTNIANEAQAAHTMINGAFGVAGGVARGAAMGPMGALTGGASGALNWAQAGMGAAVDMNQRNQQLGVATGLSTANLNDAQANSGFIRDTNRDLARFSAQGDYANAIAGINAKVQDAKLTQPTSAGQIGGDAYNLATYYWGVDLKIKMLQPAAMNAIGEFWLRYGYAVNRFSRMPASLMVMEKFTYWKCKEVYIVSANCPETFKQTLRGIFEKGVTVWKNPGDIGNIDTANNAPLAGVTI